MKGVLIQARRNPMRTGVQTSVSDGAQALFAGLVFFPRQDLSHQSLASFHRQVLDWLRLLAIEQLIREGRLNDYRPDRKK